MICLFRRKSIPVILSVILAVSLTACAVTEPNAAEQPVSETTGFLTDSAATTISSNSESAALPSSRSSASLAGRELSDKEPQNQLNRSAELLTEQALSADAADAADGPDVTAAGQPTDKPTEATISAPTAKPTAKAATAPTTSPTARPTVRPTAAPTSKPTAAPTSKPTAAPTSKPTTAPKPSPTTAPTPTPTTAPTPTPTATPTPADSGSSLTASEWRAEIFRLTNAERIKAGLPALSSGTTALSNAAAVRAGEIVSSYSHVRPNGTSFSSVLAENGIAWAATAENLFRGTADRFTPADVVRKWMASDGHKANILNKNQTMLSIGYKRSGGLDHFVQLFIKPK